MMRIGAAAVSSNHLPVLQQQQLLLLLLQLSQPFGRAALPRPPEQQPERREVQIT